MVERRDIATILSLCYSYFITETLSSQSGFYIYNLVIDKSRITDLRALFKIFNTHASFLGESEFLALLYMHSNFGLNFMSWSQN